MSIATKPPITPSPFKGLALPGRQLTLLDQPDHDEEPLTQGQLLEAASAIHDELREALPALIRDSVLVEVAETLKRLVREEVRRALADFQGIDKEQVEKLLERMQRVLEARMHELHGDYVKKVEDYEQATDLKIDGLKALLSSLPAAEIHVSVPPEAIRVETPPSVVHVQMPERRVEKHIQYDEYGRPATIIEQEQGQSETPNLED